MFEFDMTIHIKFKQEVLEQLNNVDDIEELNNLNHIWNGTIDLES